MASPFDRVAAMAAVAIAAVAGERLRLVPMAVGRYKDATVDGARAALETVGTVSTTPGRMKLGRSDFHEDFARAAVASRIVARIELARLADTVWRAGDHVMRLDRPGQPALEIVAVDPPSLGAASFVLAAITSEPAP